MHITFEILNIMSRDRHLASLYTGTKFSRTVRTPLKVGWLNLRGGADLYEGENAGRICNK